MSRNTDFNDSSSGQITTGADSRNRRLLVGSAAGLLLGSGALAALYFGSNGPVTSSRPLLAQVGPPGRPGVPGAGRPGVPGRPGAPSAPAGGNTSFAGAPPGYKALQGGGGGAGAGAPGGFPGGTPAAAAAPGDFSKLSPVRRGAKAAGFRGDPFVSFRIQPYQKPPAYSLIAPEDVAPLRLAPFPEPPRPKRNPDPNIEFGPLQYVPRRVAGVLIRGGVSAILETGGLGGDTQLVYPGSTVPSGIGGVGNLTVSSITPTQLTLRARDGRTVSVDLSASAVTPPQVGGGGFEGGGQGGQGGIQGSGGRGGVGQGLE